MGSANIMREMEAMSPQRATVGVKVAKKAARGKKVATEVIENLNESFTSFNSRKELNYGVGEEYSLRPTRLFS